MSSAAASDNSDGRDHIIGFRTSSDQRSDDRNQCYIKKKDSNFLLYENHSIMNTKIRITGHFGGV